MYSYSGVFSLDFDLSCLPCFQSSSSEPDAKKQKMTEEKPLAEIMTPSIVKVVEFAKRIPGFTDVSYKLLKSEHLIGWGAD